MKIFLNSSPLLFLARLDFLRKFVDVYNEFYLPTFVVNEISAKQDKASEDIRDLINTNQIKVRTINLAQLANSLNEGIGKGEAEASTLGIELQNDYIIIDDFAARKEAMRLGLNVKGTLAIIRKLNLDGKIKIDNLDSLYQALMEANFRVKRSLFDTIFPD